MVEVQSATPATLDFYRRLTLSLPRVINFTFLLQPYQKYHITQYGKLGFSYLTLVSCAAAREPRPRDVGPPTSTTSRVRGSQAAAQGTNLTQMRDDYTSNNSHLDLTYAFSLYKVRRMYFLSMGVKGSTLSLLSSKSVFSQPFKKRLYEWCSENL